MKSKCATLFFLALFLSGSGFSQQASLPGTGQPSLSAEAATQRDTPAQRRVLAAQQQIEKDPKKVQAYNELALALLRRTRETADPKYLADADDLLVYRAPRRSAACLAVLRAPDAIFLNDAERDLGKMLLAEKRQDDAIQLQLILI